MNQKEREALCKDEVKDTEEIDLDYIDSFGAETVPLPEDDDELDKIPEEEKAKMKDDIIITDEEVDDFMYGFNKLS